MKLSTWDKILRWVSPKAALKRLAYKRAYDAALTYSHSDWIGASGSSANSEVAAGQKPLQHKSRDLGRNNPYFVRGLNVIVNNVVGAGIVANIKGRTKSQEKKLRQLWKEVAETSKCDVEGRNNFYAKQALAMRAIAESGEIISLKRITLEAPKVQILESDFIVSDSNTKPWVQGIKLDQDGKPIVYRLYKEHPGDANYSAISGQYIDVPADQLAHAFRQERPGQRRGVPWSHAVIETLKDFADFQNATLVARKISACFVGLITTSGNESLANPADLRAKREAELQMNPGTFRYLNPGEDVKFNSPPGVDGYAEFVRESMRAVAAGLGISYEAMTGDYSQVNFSSGRMGHIEFRRNIDTWRWNILIPQFCDPYFEWFLEWAKLKGIDTTGAYVEWVPPAHVMIDPTKEVLAEKEAVLAGFKSRSQVIREQGNDPESVREEIRLEREADLEAGLKFDTDIASSIPAQSAQGNNDNEENDKDAPDEPNAGDGE